MTAFTRLTNLIVTGITNLQNLSLTNVITESLTVTDGAPITTNIYSNNTTFFQASNGGVSSLELYLALTEAAIGTSNNISFSIYTSSGEKITIKQTTGNIVLAASSNVAPDNLVDRVQIVGTLFADSEIKGTGFNDLSKSVMSANGLTTTTLNTYNNYYTGTAGASFAITFPAASSSIDGQKRVVMSTVARAVTTYISSGATFVGAPAALVANTPVCFHYDHATLKWYISL